MPGDDGGRGGQALASRGPSVGDQWPDKWAGGRAVRTGGRAAGEGVVVREQMSSAVGRRGT
jgi:hypothetical protein